ncbi:MAG: cupin domain-containing protein [Candidatus Micrarchaeota archaeon]
MTESKIKSAILSLDASSLFASVPIDPLIGVKRKLIGPVGPYLSSAAGLSHDEILSELSFLGLGREPLDSLELHAVLLPPGGKLNPHFHEHGDEIYFVIAGHGIIKLGSPRKLSDGSFACDFSSRKQADLRPGDTLIVRAREVHCPLNPRGRGDLVLAFICPADHLDNLKNRTMAKEID